MQTCMCLLLFASVFCTSFTRLLYDVWSKFIFNIYFSSCLRVVPAWKSLSNSRNSHYRSPFASREFNSWWQLNTLINFSTKLYFVCIWKIRFDKNVGCLSLSWPLVTWSKAFRPCRYAWSQTFFCAHSYLLSSTSPLIQGI